MPAANKGWPSACIIPPAIGTTRISRHQSRRKTKRETSNLDRYTDYLKAQTSELVKNYGPLFTIWFDVPQRFDAVRGQGVIDTLRALQPDLVINNRTGAKGDYSTPEQKIGKFDLERPWETCMTICQQWPGNPTTR